MEILSEILKSLQVNGSVYFCDHVDPPWVKAFIDTTTASFHLLRRGYCWVEIDGQVEYLGPGDLIFIGPGIDHTLSSESPQATKTPSTNNTLLLCGYCSFDDNTLTPLNKVFPRFAIVRDEELQKYPWLKSTFDQLSAEYMAQKPGTEIIVNKLTEVVLVELVRINFGREHNSSFLLALNDQRISKALTIIHSAYQKPLTLEGLASQIGLSRSAFAKKFTAMIGEPMFAYLSKVRIQKARELLTNSQLAVDDIAYHVGYESVRAFTKTFKKYNEMTPIQYRNSSSAS